MVTWPLVVVAGYVLILIVAIVVDIALSCVGW